MELKSESPLTQIMTRRNEGFAALRAALTLLVVFHHTAITYGAIGGWFYREVPTDTSLTSTLLVFFCTVNQAFFMGLFFLLAGYYTPSAMQRKGSLRFLVDRLLRLGLPLLVFGWGLGPVTIALAQTHRGQPFTSTLMYLWSKGTFENGPLWFAQALLIFSLGATLLATWVQSDWTRVPSMNSQASEFPSDLKVAILALGTGAAALALRSVWPVGVNIWGLQLGYFASYVVLFAVGCIAARPHWLERLPKARVQIWWRVGLIALPVLPITYFLGGAVPELRGHVLDVVYAFWEPFVACGMIILLLDRFQHHFVTLESFWRPLARRAYTIYIVHPPVLVAVALAWRDVPVNPMLKFAVTGSVTCAVCFLIAGWLVRLPGVRRVL